MHAAETSRASVASTGPCGEHCETLEHLQLTVDWARQTSAFYRDLIDSDPSPLSSLADFVERFPLVDRAFFAAQPGHFLDLSVPPVAINVTSGTTADDHRPLLLYYNDLELSARAKALRLRLDDPDASGPVPLSLQLSNGSHGVPLGPPRIGALVLPLRKAGHVRAVADVLTQEFRFAGLESRVTQLMGTLPLVRMLTVLFIEQGLKVSDFAVARIAVWGSCLTARWRSILENWWECPVDDFYGLAEIPGLLCRRRAAADTFQFVGPTLLEAVRLAEDKPVTTGFARLIATPLLPFSASRPVLRYDTGDLVRVVDWTTGPGVKEFELHGRRSDSIVWDTAAGLEPLLTAVELHEIVDGLSAVNTEAHPDRASLGAIAPVGWPVYATEFTGNRQLTLHLELRFAPHEYPRDVHTLTEQVERTLCAASDRLGAAVADGDVDLSVVCHSPGTVRSGVVV
jgi:phenylacetate-coenzyme A ligase PaaK-like adenylate-forming protein